ncbi:class I SAM-dependent methyltransferase [Candidatus Dependentiae bacterium]|nr:class I SAM-dependent methyltransferase [Candidatus Dependentiae bacterium]
MSNWNQYWNNRSKTETSDVSASGYTQSGNTVTPEIICSMQEDISKKLEISAADKMLEVGCGAGMHVKVFKPKVKQIIGIDLAFGMTNRAKSECGINTVNSGSVTLPFKNSIFDKLLCYSVFHYFCDYDYALNVVKEFLRVVKPGGIILIGDIPDKNKRNQYLNYMNKGNKINNFKDKIKYIINGLNIKKYNLELFYKKEFFKDININGAEISIVEQNYKPCRILTEMKIRFDVVIKKK